MIDRLNDIIMEIDDAIFDEREPGCTDSEKDPSLHVNEVGMRRLRDILGKYLPEEMTKPHPGEFPVEPVVVEESDRYRFAYPQGPVTASAKCLENAAREIHMLECSRGHFVCPCHVTKHTEGCPCQERFGEVVEILRRYFTGATGLPELAEINAKLDLLMKRFEGWDECRCKGARSATKGICDECGKTAKWAALASLSGEGRTK